MSDRASAWVAFQLLWSHAQKCSQQMLPVPVKGEGHGRRGTDSRRAGHRGLQLRETEVEQLRPASGEHDVAWLEV